MKKEKRLLAAILLHQIRNVFFALWGVLAKPRSKTSNYIENLIFRLNNDIQAGHRAGYELTDGCSKFSAENLSDTLKFFINGLKTTKGIERNLFAKKFLSNIFYSSESIKIRFISRQSDGEAVAKRSPAPPMAVLGERTLSTSKFEFVSSFLAPAVGFEPTTKCLTGTCATAALRRKVFLFYQISPIITKRTLSVL